MDMLKLFKINKMENIEFAKGKLEIPKRVKPQDITITMKR
jgi:hypothetical protein